MSEPQFTPMPAAPRAAGAVPYGRFGQISPFRSSLPVSPGGNQQKWFPPLVVMPSVPTAIPAAPKEFVDTWQIPLSALPTAPAKLEVDEGYLPEIFLPTEKLPVAAETVTPAPAVFEKSPEAAASQETPDYTDDQLVGAFAPIMDAAVRKAVFSLEKSNLDAFLEPMLRATVRRALAEYTPASKPFQPPGFADRTIWRFQALFSSRTYEEVLFEKTNRFQVEEVYLLDAETLALISFASCDPGRHSAVKRIESSAQRIALQIRTEEGELRRSFERSDGKSVISEKGQFVLLVAIVRGQPNEMIIGDLEYSLHRIEEHFQERFQQAGSALMHALQPFLEDCLLIQAPASAA